MTDRPDHLDRAARFAETYGTPATPVDPGAIDRFVYGSPDPVDAVIRAWVDPGVNPHWHAFRRDMLHRDMPVLAAALDRLAAQRS